MRIACPGCSAAYDVPAESLPPGRAVRCVRCETMWTPVAQVDATPEIMPRPDPVPPRPAIEAAHETPQAAPAALESPPAEQGQPSIVALPVPAAAPVSHADTVMAPGAADTSSAQPPIAALAVPAVTEEAAPARNGLVVLAGWLLTIAMLGFISWIGMTKRAEIMHAWPQSERLYALLGLIK